jgi:response regulator RpfG family c-di-GMP phosphodiesterase
LVTAVDHDDQSVLKGYGSGAVDYVNKPISPSILRSKVEVFLTMFHERKARETANEKYLTLQMDLAVAAQRSDKRGS